jgi:hypothetical protein
VSAPVRPAATALLATLLATVPAACGKDPADRFSGERRAAALAVDRLGDAARDGDAAEICSHLLAQSVKARLGLRCPARIAAALRALNDPGLEVVAVRLRGSRAVVTVVAGTADPRRSGDVTLLREAGRWRIATVGPLPPLSPELRRS